MLLSLSLSPSLLSLSPSDCQTLPAGDEPGELGVLRTKLLQFLQTSKHYEASMHISKFPKEGICPLM
jgi:hypothetical protein